MSLLLKYLITRVGTKKSRVDRRLLLNKICKEASSQFLDWAKADNIFASYVFLHLYTIVPSFTTYANNWMLALLSDNRDLTMKIKYLVTVATF